MGESNVGYYNIKASLAAELVTNTFNVYMSCSKIGSLLKFVNSSFNIQ